MASKKAYARFCTYNKAKVSPIYNPYVEEVSARENTCLPLCEVGRPVPFLTASISLVFLPGPYSLLDGR